MPFVMSCVRGEVAPGGVDPGGVRPGGVTRPGRTPAAAREPEVRIGILVDTTAAVVTATTRFTIAATDGSILARANAGTVWTFSADGLLVRGSGSDGTTIGPAQPPLRIMPADTGSITIGGKTYRGSALLRSSRDGRVSAINVVDIEDYLAGVVSFEIGKLSPALVEAVKAQAIAARTYAIGNLNRWQERGFDFYPTVLDQVYGGVTGEDSVTSRAVRETSGQIVSYEGKPILAYYSSTCGGQTAAIEDSWPWRSGLPYLRSVPDTMGSTGRAYCETSNRYRWTVSWTRETLKSVLAETLGALEKGRLAISRPNPADRIEIGRVQSVELSGRSPGGRARYVRLRVDGKTHDLRADSVRWILRPTTAALLNSSFLSDVQAEVVDGEVHKLDVSGKGWGHGIGMCQVGAINRARAGQSYRQILLAYYSGTQIDKLY